MSSSLDPNWRKLPSLPTHSHSTYGVVAKMNSCSFVSMVKTSDASRKRMMRYNTHKNEWEFYYRCPLFKSLRKYNLVYNKQEKQLFLYGKSAQIIVFNTKNGSFETFETENGFHYPCLSMDGNDIIHIIGGKGNSKHLIWDNNKSLLLESDDLNWPNSSRKKENKCDIEHSKSIYIASKKAIILIGGYGSNGESIGIWKYSLQTRFWSILYAGNEFNICGVSAVLTQDERYIIIMNGYDIDFSYSPPHHASNAIFIIDIPTQQHGDDDKKYVLHKIKNIKTPMKGRHYMVTSGGNLFEDKLIVFGWLRKYEIVALLPHYIKELIVGYFKLKEMIHWMDKDRMDTNQHCGILVNDILQYHPNKKTMDRAMQLTQNVLTIFSFLLLPVPRPWQK